MRSVLSPQQNRPDEGVLLTTQTTPPAAPTSVALNSSVDANMPPVKTGYDSAPPGLVQPARLPAQPTVPLSSRMQVKVSPTVTPCIVHSPVPVPAICAGVAFVGGGEPGPQHQSEESLAATTHTCVPPAI